MKDNYSRSLQIELLKPTYSEQPKSWKFIVPNTDVTEQEEVVLSVQGIITHTDLPPFTKRYANKWLHIHHHLTKRNQHYETNARLPASECSADGVESAYVRDVHWQPASSPSGISASGTCRRYGAVLVKHSTVLSVHRVWNTILYISSWWSAQCSHALWPCYWPQGDTGIHDWRRILPWRRQRSALLSPGTFVRKRPANSVSIDLKQTDNN